MAWHTGTGEIIAKNPNGNWIIRPAFSMNNYDNAAGICGRTYTIGQIVTYGYHDEDDPQKLQILEAGQDIAYGGDLDLPPVTQDAWLSNGNGPGLTNDQASPMPASFFNGGGTAKLDPGWGIPACVDGAVLCNGWPASPDQSIIVAGYGAINAMVGWDATHGGVLAAPLGDATGGGNGIIMGTTLEAGQVYVTFYSNGAQDGELAVGNFNPINIGNVHLGYTGSVNGPGAISFVPDVGWYLCIDGEMMLITDNSAYGDFGYLTVVRQGIDGFRPNWPAQVSHKPGAIVGIAYWVQDFGGISTANNSTFPPTRSYTPTGVSVLKPIQVGDTEIAISCHGAAILTPPPDSTQSLYLLIDNEYLQVISIEEVVSGDSEVPWLDHGQSGVLCNVLRSQLLTTEAAHGVNTNVFIVAGVDQTVINVSAKMPTAVGATLAVGIGLSVNANSTTVGSQWMSITSQGWHILPQTGWYQYHVNPWVYGVIPPLIQTRTDDSNYWIGWVPTYVNYIDDNGVMGDQITMALQFRGSLCKLSLQDGSILWQIPMQPPPSSIVVGYGVGENDGIDQRSVYCCNVLNCLRGVVDTTLTGGGESGITGAPPDTTPVASLVRYLIEDGSFGWTSAVGAANTHVTITFGDRIVLGPLMCEVELAYGNNWNAPPIVNCLYGVGLGQQGAMLAAPDSRTDDTGTLIPSNTLMLRSVKNGIVGYSKHDGSRQWVTATQRLYSDPNGTAVMPTYADYVLMYYGETWTGIVDPDTQLFEVVFPMGLYSPYGEGSLGIYVNIVMCIDENGGLQWSNPYEMQQDPDYGDSIIIYGATQDFVMVYIATVHTQAPGTDQHGVIGLDYHGAQVFSNIVHGTWQGGSYYTYDYGQGTYADGAQAAVSTGYPYPKVVFGLSGDTPPEGMAAAFWPARVGSLPNGTQTITVPSQIDLYTKSGFNSTVQVPGVVLGPSNPAALTSGSYSSMPCGTMDEPKLLDSMLYVKALAPDATKSNPYDDSNTVLSRLM